MIFSLGGLQRGFLVIVTAVLLSVSVSACSAGDDKPTDTKTTATPDPVADDKAAVKNLVDRYWVAVVSSENAADPDPKQFVTVAKGSFIEDQLRRLRVYESAGIRRVGRPEITAVEVDISGDTADIRLCLNEDEWTAEKNGDKIKAKKFGNRPFGAEATRLDDKWLVTGLRPSKTEKVC